MKKLMLLLQNYKGTLIPAPIPIGVQLVNRNTMSYDCHCSSEDCSDCYDCHCSSEDCSDCYDCHCSSDDCVN